MIRWISLSLNEIRSNPIRMMERLSFFLLGANNSKNSIYTESRDLRFHMKLRSRIWSRAAFSFLVFSLVFL